MKKPNGLAPVDAAGLLTEVRGRRPLIHHITNWVTISECAAVVRAFGAAPVMAHAIEEAGEMTLLADALVLNIGTIDRPVLEAMKRAALAANRKGIPIVLDACGAGATLFRDQACRELLRTAHVDLLKGNASEIAKLAGGAVLTRGVDSGAIERVDLETLVQTLARTQDATVIVTGKVDLVCSPDGALLHVANGHPLMAECVGTGCMAASAIGTFAAVKPQALAAAAAAALACYEIAAENAAPAARGPADFKSRLLDAVSHLAPEHLAGRVRITAAQQTGEQ